MRFLHALAATCVLSLISVPVMAQSKIAVVDFQKAALESAEFKKAYSALEAKYKSKQDQLAKAQNELSDLEVQLRTSGADISPAGRAELQSRYQRKQTQVQRLTEDIQQDFQSERDAAVQLISTRLTDVIKKFAEDNQLDVVLDIQASHFVRAAMNVTEKVIAAYNAAHPAN